MVATLTRKAKNLARRLIQPRLEDLPNAPDLFRQYRHFTRSAELVRRPGGWTYQGRFYPDYLTTGGASHVIARQALRFCQGSGLDIGAGLWPLPGAIPVDIWRGPGAGRTLEECKRAEYDFVFSSHCLEHITAWREALREWASKIKPGGILFLYLPHPDCGLWQPGSPFVGDEHKWAPTPSLIKEAVSALGFELVECDDGPDAYFSFHVCGKRLPSPYATVSL